MNKAASHPQIPLLVHCSGGVGRTGTYLLIDMALTRIQSGKWWVGLVLSGCGYYNDMEHNYVFSGAKEINLAASVEHLRDNRPHMVKTKVCTCM